MSFLTCFWLLPQKEHLSRSPPSPMRTTRSPPGTRNRPTGLGGWIRRYRVDRRCEPLFRASGARFGVSDTICNEREPDQRRGVTRSAQCPLMGERSGGPDRGELAAADDLVDEAVL